MAFQLDSGHLPSTSQMLLAGLLIFKRIISFQLELMFGLVVNYLVN